MENNKTNNKSSLATASMVLGIIGVCISFIPILNVISFVLGLLAFVFGIIAIVKKMGIGQAITGLVLGIASIIIMISIMGGTADTINDAVDKINSNTSQTNEKNSKKANAKSIIIGETVTEKDWEITVKETNFKQDVIPSNPDSFYTHYQVKDTDNIYMYVVLTAKNISTLALDADKVAKVKFKYDNKYEYNAFSAVEKKGGGTFTYTNITRIDPLTAETLYYLVEVPKTIADETDTPVEAEITINNNIYNLKIR